MAQKQMEISELNAKLKTQEKEKRDEIFRLHLEVGVYASAKQEHGPQCKPCFVYFLLQWQSSDLDRRHYTFSFFSKSNAQSIGHKLSNAWSKEGPSFQEEYRFLWEGGQHLRSRLILVYAGRIRPPSQHGQSTGILALSPEEIVEPFCFIWIKIDKFLHNVFLWRYNSRDKIPLKHF